jgi:hypothetical protein
MTKVTLRIGDSISIDGPWFTVEHIDQANDLVTLLGDGLVEVHRSLAEFTHDVETMTNGVRAYVVRSARWKPIPAGHVFYGETLGHRAQVIGGYVKDESGEYTPHPDPEAFMVELRARWAKEGRV